MFVILKELLNRHSFRFSKKFGQNFISDTNLLRAIVADSGITENSCVLEIGAGAGTLTRLLADTAKSVVSFEIDKSLAPVLEESLAGRDNIKLVFEDFLKLGDKELAALFPHGAIDAVANLPYYITTPILFKLLEAELDIRSITVMLQKEVAERLTAEAGTKEYGVITAVIGYRHDVKITRAVNRSLFFPPPAVDSAVVKITENKNKPRAKSDQAYYRLVRAAFGMRRKTLLNNLISALPLSRTEAEQLIARAGFPADIRGERLCTQDFIRLADEIIGKN